MSKYLSVKYLLLSKKAGTLGYAVSKTDFWGLFGGPREGSTPQTMSKYLFLKYLLISKKTSALAQAVKKLIFGAPF